MSSSPSFFLQLPCELRLEIYSHLFESSPELPKLIHLRAPRFLPLNYSASSLLTGSIISQKQWTTTDTARGETDQAESMPFGHVERSPAKTPTETAILLTCRQLYAEALDMYWGTFTIILDSPIKFIPLLLTSVPTFLRPCLKMLNLSRHLVRPLDPTASGHAKTWKEACMRLSRALPRIEDVGLELNGDIGTLTMEEGRGNVFNALVACGWVGKRGSLRRLTVMWVCSGWEEEEDAAAALVAIGARATVEGKDGVVRRIFTFEDRKAPFWQWTLDSKIAPCCGVS